MKNLLEAMPNQEIGDNKKVLTSLNKLRLEDGDKEIGKGRAMNILFIHDEIKGDQEDAANKFAEQLEELGDVKFLFGSNNVEKSSRVAEYLKSRMTDVNIKKDRPKKELDGARSTSFDQEYLKAMRDVATENGVGAMVDFWMENPNENSPQSETHIANYQKMIDKLAEISKRMSATLPEVSVVCVVDPSINAWLSTQTGQKNTEIEKVVKIDNPIILRFRGDNSPKNFSFNGKEYPLRVNDWKKYISKK